jgi:EH domain-containing protein 1
VQLEHHLPVGDFPNVHKFRETLRAYDLSKFPKLEKKHLEKIKEVLNEDIPGLLRQFDNPF